MPSHHERRRLPYAQQQLFDLVADVEKYPEFIPWFVAVRVRQRDATMWEVDQIVRFNGMRARFTTHAVLQPPERILIDTADPPFRNFSQRWSFAPAQAGTTVDYESRMELRSTLLQHAMQALFGERQVARETVDCFAARAQQLYGPAALS